MTQVAACVSAVLRLYQARSSSTIITVCLDMAPARRLVVLVLMLVRVVLVLMLVSVVLFLVKAGQLYSVNKCLLV